MTKAQAVKLARNIVWSVGDVDKLAAVLLETFGEDAEPKSAPPTCKCFVPHELRGHCSSCGGHVDEHLEASQFAAGRPLSPAAAPEAPPLTCYLSAAPLPRPEEPR